MRACQLYNLTTRLCCVCCRLAINDTKWREVATHYLAMHNRWVLCKLERSFCYVGLYLGVLQFGVGF